MSQRLNYKNAAPKGFEAMLALEGHVRASGLEHALLELVKTRVSQINGCAFCLDMHTKDARAAGESEQRLYMLSAWREAGRMYTPRERAALGWAEAVTTLPHHEVNDEIYREARQHFDEKALVDLTLAVVAINGWNRLSIAFRTEAGTYQPAAHTKT